MHPKVYIKTEATPNQTHLEHPNHRKKQWTTFIKNKQEKGAARVRRGRRSGVRGGGCAHTCVTKNRYSISVAIKCFVILHDTETKRKCTLDWTPESRCENFGLHRKKCIELEIILTLFNINQSKSNSFRQRWVHPNDL